MYLSPEERLHAILEGTEAGTWEWNLDSDDLTCNERWAGMLGYSLDDLSPVSKDTLVALCHPDDRHLAESVFKQFLSGREARYETTLRFKHKTDGWRYIRTRAVLAKRHAPAGSRWLVGTNEDVTGEHAAKHQVELIAESMPGLIYSFVVRPDGYSYFSYISKKVEEFYGVTQEMAKRDAMMVYRSVIPEDRDKIEKTLTECARSLSQWRCDYRVRSKDTVRWMRTIAVPEKESDGSICWQGVVINVDTEKRLALALEELSVTDELSGLYNRRFLFQRLYELIATVDRHGGEFSLLALDIDHFKKVNDTYGHQEGDEVIRAFGRLLKQRLRKSDIAARTGGEEFTVVMPNTDLQMAKSVAEDLNTALSGKTFGESKQGFSVSFSGGVVSYPTDASSLDLLVSRSDRLLYEAKRLGRNRIVIAR